jgi:hypothetical protein
MPKPRVPAAPIRALWPEAEAARGPVRARCRTYRRAEPPVSRGRPHAGGCAQTPYGGGTWHARTPGGRSWSRHVTWRWRGARSGWPPAAMKPPARGAADVGHARCAYGVPLHGLAGVAEET